MKEMPRRAIELRLEWLSASWARDRARRSAPYSGASRFGVAESKVVCFRFGASWRATKDVSLADDCGRVGRMMATIPSRRWRLVAARVARNRSASSSTKCATCWWMWLHRGLQLLVRQRRSVARSLRARGAPARGQSHRQHQPSCAPPCCGPLRNIQENAKHRELFRIFEIGLEIHKREQGLPEEVPRLAAACSRGRAMARRPGRNSPAAEC